MDSLTRLSDNYLGPLNHFYGGSTCALRCWQRVNPAHLMKRKLSALSQEYVAALKNHLKQGPQAGLQPARGLGRRAVAIGLETLDLARIHERALATLEASSSRDGYIKRAEIFFTEAVTPIEETHRAALKANAQLNRVSQTLDRR